MKFSKISIIILIVSSINQNFAFAQSFRYKITNPKEFISKAKKYQDLNIRVSIESSWSPKRDTVVSKMTTFYSSNSLNYFSVNYLQKDASDFDSLFVNIDTTNRKISFCEKKSGDSIVHINLYDNNYKLISYNEFKNTNLYRGVCYINDKEGFDLISKEYTNNDTNVIKAQYEVNDTTFFFKKKSGSNKFDSWYIEVSSLKNDKFERVDYQDGEKLFVSIYNQSDQLLQRQEYLKNNTIMIKKYSYLKGELVSQIDEYLEVRKKRKINHGKLVITYNEFGLVVERSYSYQKKLRSTTKIEYLLN